jgi:Cellulase (glycosyl hydrolase family 5)
MQTLMNTVRAAAPNNLVLVAGTNWGFDLSQLSSYPITGSNIVYDTHPYPYPGKMPQNWYAAFGYLTTTAPVMSAESGQYDCKSDYMSQLLAYFDAHNIGWTAWSWYDVGNPTNTNCQVTIEYLTQPDQGPGGTKTVSVSVLASRRVTEWVDGDLGTSPTGPGISDAAIVSVDTTITPSCSGIVAERPMYFNALGSNSGSDVVGITQHMFHTNDGYNGYEVSMAVQSSSGPFVVERPMYWNASSTEGGTDVVGFTG